LIRLIFTFRSRKMKRFNFNELQLIEF